MKTRYWKVTAVALAWLLTGTAWAVDPNDYKLTPNSSLDVRVHKTTGALLVDTSGTSDSNQANTLLNQIAAADSNIRDNTRATATNTGASAQRDANNQGLLGAILAGMSTGLPEGYGYLEVGDSNDNGTALLTLTAACSQIVVGAGKDGNAALLSLDGGANWKMVLAPGATFVINGSFPNGTVFAVKDLDPADNWCRRVFVNAIRSQP